MDGGRDKRAERPNEQTKTNAVMCPSRAGERQETNHGRHDERDEQQSSKEKRKPRGPEHLLARRSLFFCCVGGAGAQLKYQVLCCCCWLLVLGHFSSSLGHYLLLAAATAACLLYMHMLSFTDSSVSLSDFVRVSISSQFVGREGEARAPHGAPSKPNPTQPTLHGNPFTHAGCSCAHSTRL